MPRRHASHAKVVTAFVRIPEALEPGKVRCNACRKAVALTSTGRTRKHKTPAGEDCAYQAVYAPKVELDELPPVVIPAQRGSQLPRPERKRKAPAEPRVTAYGECRECGKWLPGERTLCGWCFVKGGN